MKNIPPKVVLTLFAICIARISFPQNIGINTTGTAPSSLNLLEVVQSGTANNSTGISVSHSGASAATSYALKALKTGASLTNIAAYLSSTGGTNNYSLIVPSGGGWAGIGTTAPLFQLDVRGTTPDANGTFENIMQVGSNNATGPLAIQLGIQTGAAGNQYGGIAVDDGGTARPLVLQDNGGRVGIGAKPGTSAGLDINFSNKGVLLPQISLSSASDNTTIASPATSLLVYNTNASMTNGYGTGFYYNAGTAVSPDWVSFATTSNSIMGNMQVFNANGTFTVPAGVTRIMIEAWGGGGGGSGLTGGGGGGYGKKIVAVTPGTVLTITVGAGGAEDTNGGTTSVTDPATLISATGGNSGSPATGGTSTAAFKIVGERGNGDRGGNSGCGGFGAYNGGDSSSDDGGDALYSGTAPGGGGGGGGNGGVGYSDGIPSAGAAGRVLISW